MRKLALTAALLQLVAPSAFAQTYTQLQLGLNKTVNPYQFGANINGSWYNLGTVSSNGVWNIPITVLSVNSAYNSEKTISVTSAPSYTFPEALATEFQGDFSNTFLPLLYTVTGAATLGQPTTGYQWNPAVTPVQSLSVNNSGWNQSTSGNDGRTGFATYRSMVQQNGQGDAMPYFGFCSVTASQRAGATHWLANPACALLAGNLGTTTDHTYLQGLGDISFTDNGKDIAVVADERGFFRTNNTAAFGEVWLGYLSQSSGTKNIDVAVAVNGPTSVGVDTVIATGLSAALNMKADQKILLNSTATPLNGISWYGNNYGGSYLTHSSGASEVRIGYNNVPAAAFTAGSSATDYLLLGATASAGAYLAAESSNTNAGVTYATKGNGSHFFKTGGLGGSINFAAVYAPSSVNYVQVIPAATLAAPTIQSTGSDTNINLALSGKGTGTVNVPAGTLALGATGTTVGSLSFANATSGTITIQPTTGALGTVTATLPANTGTLAELNLAQTWTALQTFSSGLSVANTVVSGTAPTISSGFGTSPSVTASNGTAAFRINVGTGGTATSGVVGLPAAANGWNCFASDITTPGTGHVIKQFAGTTTSVTLTNYNNAGTATAWAANDIIIVNCMGY